MKLYAWQQECLNAWDANHCRGIAHVVTGAGKTVLALNAMDLHRAYYPDSRVKIIVPTIPLALQWQTAILHHVADPALRPGFFGGGIRDHADRPVMIYIINSARDALTDHIRKDFALGRHVLLICDECHHYQSSQNRRIFDFTRFPYAGGEQYACLGLSATPFGSPDDAVLTDALGPVVFHYDVSRASADGIVSPFTVSEVAVSFLPDERAEYQKLSYELMLLMKKLLVAWPELQGLSSSAFMKALMKLARAAGMNPENLAVSFLLKTWQRKEICVLADARQLCAMSLIEQLPSDNRILIFCERISQAERMYRFIQRKHGRICSIYHSEMSGEARQRNLENFRNKSVRILVACRCLDEGLDVPDASVGIILSGAAVARQRIQRLGRILRKAEGKASADLYYLYIQESSEDSSFLPGLKAEKSVSLHFRSLEQSFENDLYVYAAAELLSEAKAAGLTENQLRELRRCINEGLVRTDYLLSPEIQQANLRSSKDTHTINYWQAMIRLGIKFS